MGDDHEKQFSHSERRAKIRQEIIDTEDKYVTCLNYLTATYVAHINLEKHNAKEYSMEEQAFDIMASNISTLTNIHNAFLQELREGDPVEVALVLNKYADIFKMYIFYLNGYEALLQCLSALKSHKKGKALVDEIEKQLAGLGSLNLMSYLIMPVQRIPRYVLLLAELVKASSEGHPQYVHMKEALEKVQKIATTINDAKRKMEAMTKLVEVAARIHHVPSTFHIVLPYRRLVREGLLVVTMESGATGKATMKKHIRHVFLFNDYIVFTNEDYDWKGSLTLSAATLDKDGGDDTFSVSTAKMFLCFQSHKTEERHDWLRDIEDQIERLKKMRESKRHINARTKRSMGSLGGHSTGSVHNLILGSLTHLKQDSVHNLHDHEHENSHSHSGHGGHSGHGEHEGDDFDHHAPEVHEDHDDHHHDD